MTDHDDTLAARDHEIAELRAALLAEQVAKNVAWESYHLAVRRLESELRETRVLADGLYRELAYWKARCGVPQPGDSIVVDISTGGRE